MRSLTYDGAGNILTDTRSGIVYTYTYNKANRLKTVTSQSNLLGTYTYNGFDQLITRVITNSGSANGTVNTVQDIWGNVIAELDGTGATVREYIWLPETEIAPTRQARTLVDRPIAVIDGVNTASPTTLYVHVDHLNRPVRMTNSAKASVWDVVWNAWGAPYAITGAQTLNARFPGQWYQLEAGLNYNWHRHYDPTLGRYTQPDPLGFVDGPSDYAYAGNSPQIYVDSNGQIVQLIVGFCELNPGACISAGVAALGAIEYMCEMAGHKKGKRQSTKDKHEGGDARRGRDQGGEKADYPDGPRRPPQSRPKDWKGPWPPKD